MEHDLEKLLKDKLESQGISKDWLDKHLEVLTDDDKED
mgnify:FL=1|jgi:hypothetical protein|tara:strand:- start:457 stop:570 length:114 start_codon:yes stop_codon:yes gene_type:complete